MPVRTTTINADGKRDEISVKEALEFYAFIQRTRYCSEIFKVGCNQCENGVLHRVQASFLLPSTNTVGLASVP